MFIVFVHLGWLLSAGAKRRNQLIFFLFRVVTFPRGFLLSQALSVMSSHAFVTRFSPFFGGVSSNSPLSRPQPLTAAIFLCDSENAAIPRTNGVEEDKKREPPAKFPQLPGRISRGNNTLDWKGKLRTDFHCEIRRWRRKDRIQISMATTDHLLQHLHAQISSLLLSFLSPSPPPAFSIRCFNVGLCY